MGEHPYRPLPTPPRMRWTVVLVARRWPWLPSLLAASVAGSITNVALGLHGIGYWPRSAIGTAVAFVASLLATVRIIRVPVEPPQVRVAETHTMEEHRDLTDAGYVYDHEARVYRLPSRWDEGELP